MRLERVTEQMAEARKTSVPLRPVSEAELHLLANGWSFIGTMDRVMKAREIEEAHVEALETR